jgi:hypothetical protein
LAVIEQLGDGASDPEIAKGRAWPFGVRVVIAVTLVAMTIVAGFWWFRSGAFLRAQGAGYGGVVSPGEQLSFGTELTTVSGRSVVLDGVSASSPGDAHVAWSIYQNPPGALGFGSVHGPLGSEWPTMPVHGYRVSQPDAHPERGATWLVTTVTAAHPGVYRVFDISVKYHSARRARQSAAHTSICVLVAPPADEKRLTQQEENFKPHVTDLSTVDPLVAQFETCIDPALTSS